MGFTVLGCTGMNLLLEGTSRLPAGRPGASEFTEASLTHLTRPPRATLGGDAGNAGAALARLGEPVRIVPCWADDLPGARLARTLTTHTQRRATKGRSNA